jgi:hypothetical protein
VGSAKGSAGKLLKGVTWMFRAGAGRKAGIYGLFNWFQYNHSLYMIFLISFKLKPRQIRLYNINFTAGMLPSLFMYFTHRAKT